LVSVNDGIEGLLDIAKEGVKLGGSLLSKLGTRLEERDCCDDKRRDCRDAESVDGAVKGDSGGRYDGFLLGKLVASVDGNIDGLLDTEKASSYGLC